MNFRILLIAALVLSTFSCQDEAAARIAAQKKDAQKKEAVFQTLSRNWKFSEPVLSPLSQAQVANWSEWRLFLAELRQTPQSSIGAFQKKAKALSKRVVALHTNIPAKFDRPEIKSRITSLMSKVRAIDMYINVSDIPADKVTPIIGEINSELSSLARQMDEIMRRTQIPLEQGESDLIRMLDTSRAIPSTPKRQ